MIAQSIGLAVKAEDDRAVQQPIQQRGRDGGVAHDFSHDLTCRLVVKTIEVFKYRCDTT